MCGRYVVIQKVQTIEKRFGVTAPTNMVFEPSVNIGPGSKAPVITSTNPNQLSMFSFGLSPFWAKKRMYLFNARAEGDRNKANDPNYSGGNEIIKKPAFRKPIRYQRCLIPADAFIEGSTAKKLDEPYLVYLTNRKAPFAFAGIWDEWVDNTTGEIHNGFAIITTRTNTLLGQIPHHRSPVILNQEDEQTWLNADQPLADITALLQPYAGENMNAYPISREIKNPRNNAPQLIEPQGNCLRKEETYTFYTELELQGMGSKRKN